MYLKLTGLCGSWPSYELYFLLNQLLTQDEILKLKKGSAQTILMKTRLHSKVARYSNGLTAF